MLKIETQTLAKSKAQSGPIQSSEITECYLLSGFQRDVDCSMVPIESGRTSVAAGA